MDGGKLGICLGACLSYQRDTLLYCRHRKQSREKRICLNVTSVIQNIRLENPLPCLIESRILIASKMMLMVKSRLYVCARLFPSKKLVLGKTINKTASLPNRRRQLGLRFVQGEKW